MFLKSEEPTFRFSEMILNQLGLEETGLNLTGCPAGIYCGKVLNFRGILADFEKRVFLKEPVP